MKKALILFLILILFTPCIALAQEEEAPSHLTVGSVTPMRGDFFTDMWGNGTSDIDIRSLLTGFGLIRWNEEVGMFEHDDSVVAGIAAVENAAGDRTYNIILWDDMYYSDGTKITAKDYAFSFLLTIAPEIEELGGTPDEKPYILGYDEYMAGTASTLAGIRLIGENTLMITLDHEFLPFFYELALLSCVPYPIHVIAPGVEVRDDGNGIYLANADGSSDPLFTAELLQQTIMDPETGYRNHPSVVSGPYMLTKWDGAEAEFEINPYYRGNHRGNRPSVDTLTVKTADNDTMMDQLRSGEFDLLNKVTRSDIILQGIGMVGEGFQMSNYPRYGLGYIGFACEKPAVASRAVRQAIAWCLDRDELLNTYTGGFGLRIDSWYGVAQWVYSVINGTIAPPVEPPEEGGDMAAYEKELAEWDELNLDNLTEYTLDIEKAVELLEGDGWMLNADGIREKVIGGENVTLDLKLVYPKGNSAAAALEELFVPNLAEAGIRLTLEEKDMFDLLAEFYQQSERSMDMFLLGRNFDAVFDPSAHFTEEADGGHSWFYTHCVDEELYEQAVELRRTEPGNTLEYAKDWIRFEELFNKSLPMLPIYSNIYFDFFRGDLQDYAISRNQTWGEAIVDAYFSDGTEEEPAEDGEIFENEEGTIEIID